MITRGLLVGATGILLGALTLMSGCAPSAPAPAETAAADGGGEVDHVAPREIADGKGSGADDGVFPRTVVHFAGETEIAQAPERVVVIATGQLDATVTLGVIPVGAAAGSGAEAVPAYLSEQFPDRADELAAIAPVGQRTEPDVEAVAALEPDLILMNAAGDESAKTYEAMSQVAPTVATEGTGVNWKSDFLLLADALGRYQDADDWLTGFQDDAAAFGETVDPATTVSFTRLNADRLRIFQVASFAGSIAEDVGLARPESQQDPEKTSQDISPEELDLADATWIFYGVQGGDASELTGMALWPTLTAVGEGRAVQVDDDPFYLNAGPTAATVVLDQLKTSLGS